jgi:hypothetical protein
MKKIAQPTTASKPSPHVRAQFREIARDIIAEDRHARRNGLSQNTIGAIERAMVKAFVFGQEALLDDRNTTLTPATIDWLDVPPRSRDTLAYMTFAFSQRFVAALRGSTDEAGADELEVFEVSGRKRWAVVRRNVRSERSVADGSVAPLLKLGLIRPSLHSMDRYELTEIGVRVCRDYWRRSDADDPTLPRQSVR